MAQYVFREVPVGIKATGMRRERDATGSIDVPADKYWGANTQRALKAAPGYADVMPERFFRSYGYPKRAAAIVNAQAARLPLWKTAAIARAADDLIAGLLADQFPLQIWHSGSSRDANTNVNEVLANRAAQLLGVAVGNREPIDPARDVNMGQSLHANFIACVYITTVTEIEEVLVPRCSGLARALERTLGQFSSHAGRLCTALDRLDEAEGSLHEIGAPPASAMTVQPPEMTASDWQAMVGIIASDTARPFVVAPAGFSGRCTVDAMLAVMAAVRGLAIVLLDVAHALHAASDPLPAHVDGDSRNSSRIQAEALAMVCHYVISQDQMVVATASRGGTTGCLMPPVIVAAVLNALHHLGDGCEAMRRLVARHR